LINKRTLQGTSNTINKSTYIINQITKGRIMKTSLWKSGLAVLTLAGTMTATTVAGGDRKEAKKDIVETAVAAGNFKTLATALTEAGLIETLKGKGPFTVFAPTDEAFAKVPKADLENLLKDKDQLTKVLLYHVVAGKVMAGDVVKLKSAKTVEGSKVRISVSGNIVMVDDARVVATDIEASNGVIHVMDSVIMPQAPASTKGN
jgi:uncharacterized surface protein with fasciclin (FAS1) repeats